MADSAASALGARQRHSTPPVIESTVAKNESLVFARIDMSDNEMVLKSGRRLPMGAEFWDIRDDGVPVLYIDLVTEARHHNTVVYLGLGHAISDNGNHPVAQIAARLRLDIGTAQMLHKQLGDIIKEALSTTATAELIESAEPSQDNLIRWIRTAPLKGSRTPTAP